MAKNKTINEFLDDIVRVYGFSPLTDMRRRELKFKLAMADIKTTVRAEDTKLALDLVLAELQPKVSSGSVRTAAAGSHGARMTGCPRCNTPMNGVKLSNACDAYYCATCHVTIPSK